MNVVLADTGPLVAFLNRADDFHEWAKQQLAQITPPLLTCDAVIAEACWLLRDLPQGKSAVMQMIERKQLLLPLRLEDEAVSIRRLMEKYSRLPMDLADACLVRMSEQHSDCRVLTLDGDFRIYRRHGRQMIPLLIPDRS
jgi:predicted nucleic acid-binding protein